MCKTVLSSASNCSYNPSGITDEFIVKGEPVSSRLLFVAIASFACSTHLWSDPIGSYAQTNLVSNIPGLAAFTDPNLVNPWGIAASATSPFWISDNGTGVSTLY